MGLTTQNRTQTGNGVDVERHAVASADLALVRLGRGLAGDAILGTEWPGWRIGLPWPKSSLPRHLRVAA